MDDDDDVPPLEATRSRIEVEGDRNQSSLAGQSLWSLSWSKTGWFGLFGDVVFFGLFFVFFVGGGRCFVGVFCLGGEGRELGGAGAFFFLLAGVFRVFAMVKH